MDLPARLLAVTKTNQITENYKAKIEKTFSATEIHENDNLKKKTTTFN